MLSAWFEGSRSWLIQGVLLFALLAVVFPGAVFQNEGIAPADILFLIPPWESYAPEDFTGSRHRLMSDVITAFYPYYFAVDYALKEDNWPLWNPFLFGGMPLLANAQSTPLYPPRLLHVLFDIRTATAIFIILKLWLCGMSAFLCGRVMRLSFPAASFLSIAWAFASYNLIWAQWSLPDVSIWLPVLFAGIELTLQEKFRKGFFAIALGGALILLAGHPETAFAMSLGVGVYFLICLLPRWRTPRLLVAPIVTAIGAWALALAVAAPMIIPLAEYLLNSSTFFDRPHDDMITYLSPSAIVNLLVPRFFGSSYDSNFFGNINANLNSMLYPGIAVLFFASLLGAPGAWRDEWRWRIYALTAAAAFGLLMAFSAPPFDILQRLPVFSSMIHAYNIAFTLFALPVLAAHGLQHWLGESRRVRHLWPAALVAVIAALLLALTYNFFDGLIRALKISPYIEQQLVVAAALLVALFTTALLSHLERFRYIACAIILAILAADLIYANRGMNPTLPKDQIYPETALTSWMQAQGHPVRFGVAEGDVPSGLLVPYAIEDWLAYDGLYPGRMMRFHKTLREELWTTMEPVCAKQYYLNNREFEPAFPLDSQPERFEMITSFDGLDVYRNNLAFPRAFLVGGVEVIGDRDALFKRMKDASYDPSRLVVTDELAADIPAELASARDVKGSAEVTHWETTEVTVEATAQDPAVLVLGDAFYPGWRAYVDGQETEIFPAYYIFRGVLLSPGKHRIEFRYEPNSFYIGLIISIVAQVLSVLYIFLGSHSLSQDSV